MAIRRQFCYDSPMRYVVMLIMILNIASGSWAATLADVEKAVIQQDYRLAQQLAAENIKQSEDESQINLAKYWLAVSHLSLKEWSSANRLLKVLLKQRLEKDLRDRVYIGLFDSYYQQGKYKKAQKTISKLLDKSSRSNYLSLIHLKAARVNIKLAQWKAAKEHVQRIVDRYPESFEYHAARQLLDEKQYFAVQVGAFVERERALQVVDALQFQDYYAYIVETLDREQQKFYRVRVGQMSLLKEAERLRKELSRLGYPTRIYP